MADDGHVFTARCYQPDQSRSPFGSGHYPIYINFHGRDANFQCGLGNLEVIIY